ncbi:MAG: PAAR-like domain-containing protein [Polyangiaceae bacterium]
MSDVQAVGVDIVTENSNHQITGLAVSVCLTPAAPSPLPIPYPTMGMTSEGIVDAPMRTKIDGVSICTVGSCAKVCHGNEPGTLKEIVSLNTGGPTFPIMGAPNVFIELGMAAITGSPGQMNKAITVGAPSNATGAADAGGAAGGAGGTGSGATQLSGASAPAAGAGVGAGGSGAGAAASTIKGVSPSELALAAKPGSTKEQLKAREKVAKRFYKQKGAMTAAEARNHMRGIDFTKPLSVGPPPPIPSPQACWQNPGGDPKRPGQYFADPGTSPGSLGIAKNGNAFGAHGEYGAGPMGPKQATNYGMDPTTTYMQSTAAPVNDTWSAPGHSYGTEGGATQRFVPRADNASAGTAAPTPIDSN